MRLICPNCGAQYEVEDSVIPDDGRDVQCSNCGHTWFQRPAHLDQALAEELGQQFDATGGAADKIQKDETDEESKGDAPDQKPARERRSLDPEVTDVLREEAAREAAARRGESTALETQPELGLDDPGDRAASSTAAARARMARLRGDDTSPEAAAAALAAAASRRDLLPDIEEINSSLRASEDRNESVAEVSVVEEPSQEPKKGRSGFRGGFILVVLLAVIAVAVYVMAPKIIELVPQAEPFLGSYVALANELRMKSAETLATAMAKIKDLIASVTGG